MTMAANGNRRLGKGLEALLGDAAATPVPEIPRGAHVMEIEINRLDPNPHQPRQEFDDAALQELAESIAVHGIIQPILVTRGTGGRYTIIAGERRWRAARKCGLPTIPAILKEMDDQALMEVALIENLQRADLNPVEEAEAIRLLMDAYGMTQEEVAARVGKSRPAVANALRMLALTPEVLEMVRDGRLSSGHGRAILTAGEASLQLKLAQEVLQKGLSVRQTEKLAQQYKEGKNAEATKRIERDAELVSAENTLRRALGTKVALSGTLERGRITIEYFNRTDLERIYERLGGEEE